MLTIQDEGSRLCDGLSRREWLRAGSLGLFGLSLPSLLHTRRANAASAAAGRALASGIAQPALPQRSGNRVSVGSIAQLTALHTQALADLGRRLSESLRPAMLASFSKPLVGRTQPTLLHSVGANLSPMAQPPFSHAIVCPAPRTSARAAKIETHCMRQAPDDRLSRSLAQAS